MKLTSNFNFASVISIKLYKVPNDAPYIVHRAVASLIYQSFCRCSDSLQYSTWKGSNEPAT